jgi:hypothetical protein
MTRRFITGIASMALALGAVAAPSAAAVAAEPRDDDSGIVVGVEIAPRGGCVGECETVPTTKPAEGWRLADSGADIAPALLIALGLGASGLAIAGAARARGGRAESE